MAPSNSDPAPSPWLTVRESAGRGRCSPKTIYAEVKAGRLRAARIGGRRNLRLLPEWVDEWLERSATPIEIVPHISLARTR
jgi:excisionase family DNA binding protein